MQESKTALSFIDINSISPIYCNPKKAWKELLQALENIYRNFTKSEIDPEEIKIILNIEEKNKNNVPDVSSIDYVIGVINRYLHDYKISNATAPFLEFKRTAAIYLFSIGSQEKALDLLKEILQVTAEVTTTSNPDISLTCIRDCVRLNQASIQFWLGDFEESRQLLEKVITYYESTSEELYLIKMANIVSVGFTYLAWIYTKSNEYEDAERGFLHSLQVLRLVKQYTKHGLQEDNFINTKTRKIFIYDQLINFYTFTSQIEQCHQPLMEILKIMDKKTFEYDLDVRPEHHVYYYITAVFYCLRQPTIDLTKSLHYMFNIMTIIYNNSESFDMIPKCFYEKIFYMIDLIHLNQNDYMYNKNRFYDSQNETAVKEETLYNKLYDYFDEIIAIYDEEKVFSLNVEGGTIVDNMITLEKFTHFVQREDFCEFNFIKIIKSKDDESLMQPFEQEFEINEIFMTKLITERMLFKFSNLITDLVECKNITTQICMEGLTGFLVIDNDELILYCIYRYMVRDGSHIVHPEVQINLEEDPEYNRADCKHETLRIISVKNLEFKFAPLYYRRITYKLNKDAKNFNFSIYLALVNVLYSKGLYYPCVTLLGLVIEEISTIKYELYNEANQGHQKTDCFLHLYEFLLFLQIYILILLKNYDRALYQLIKLKSSINDMNNLLHKILLGICLGHCMYYELAVYRLCEAYHFIEPLLSQYNSKDGGSLGKKRIAPESKFYFLINLSYFFSLFDGNQILFRIY